MLSGCRCFKKKAKIEEAYHHDDLEIASDDGGIIVAIHTRRLQQEIPFTSTYTIHDMKQISCAYVVQ